LGQAVRRRTDRKASQRFASPDVLVLSPRGRTRAFVTALVLFVLAGCASSPEPPPDATPTEQAGLVDSTAVADDTAAVDGRAFCEREATVTVRVENKSSFDIRIAFGSYRPARLAAGFSRTTFQIARYLLRYDLRLEIVRGGLQVGPPAVIPTEPVFCNIATLVIGARPQFSVFYGDELMTPKKGKAEGEDEQNENADGAPREDGEAAGQEPAPADSTSSTSSG
jgi:hypothetical protein